LRGDGDAQARGGRIRRGVPSRRRPGGGRRGASRSADPAHTAVLAAQSVDQLRPFQWTSAVDPPPVVPTAQASLAETGLIEISLVIGELGPGTRDQRRPFQRSTSTEQCPVHDPVAHTLRVERATTRSRRASPGLGVRTKLQRRPFQWNMAVRYGGHESRKQAYPTPHAARVDAAATANN